MRRFFLGADGQRYMIDTALDDSGERMVAMFHKLDPNIQEVTEREYRRPLRAMRDRITRATRAPTTHHTAGGAG